MQIGNALRCPASKFITHTLSHLCFLILLAAATFRLGERFLPIPTTRTSAVDWFENMSLGHFIDQSKFDDDFVRSEKVESFLKGTFRPANILITNVQICLMFWVLGLLWMECKQMYNSGVRVYFLDNYNWIDFIVLSLYLSSYTLRFLVDHWIKSADSFYNGGTDRARTALIKRNYSLYDTIEHEIFTDPLRHDKSYFMQASRFEWKPNDPEIVSDVLFAVANVLSIARTTYLMPAFEVLGPLQISLGRMIGDITRFLVLFTLVLLAFMVGIHNLYWYYGSQIYYVVKEGNKKLIHTSEAFQGMPRTLLSLFWSMFGLVGVESVEIKYPKKERGDKYLSSFPGGNHATSIVEGVGQFLFALYHVAIIIVLTNMLIAMMSHSFEAIQGDCDVEWKFARTRLWVNYIDEGNTLPVPFNMIPTPKSLVYIWIWIKEIFKSKDNNLEKLNDTTKRQTFIKSRREMVCQSLSLDSPETNYSDILQRLVRRYLFKLERQKEEGKDKSGVGSDGQTLQGQPSPESYNQPEPAFADDTDDQDSNTCTSYDYQQDSATKQIDQQQQQPSNPPRYESIQPRFYEAKPGNRDSTGKMNVGFNLPETEESGRQIFPQNPSRTFKSSLSRSRFGGHSQYRSGRRPSLVPGSSCLPGGGGSTSAATVVQLISLPQIDAIQRSLKLLDVRLQHVQSAAREENHSRKDIDHIRNVMSENQKALSTVVTVLSSIQEEVRSLSVAFSKQQQQLQILPPLARKRSNETKHQQPQMTSSSSSAKLLSSPAPMSPTSPYYGNPFTISSPISPTQTTLSITSTSGYAMLPRDFRRLGARTDNSLL